MNRPEYIDRLVRLTAEISAVMDLLPHAAPLTDEAKICVQGRLLALKTSMDHSIGEHGGVDHAVKYRDVVREALLDFDLIRWDSEPDRTWYGALYRARAGVDRRLKEAGRR
jgi:hypothetical protein